MYSAIDTAGTGLHTYQTWLDTIAHNIANVNDATPTSGPAFQAQYVQAQAKGTSDGNGVGQGVEVTAIPLGNAEGILTYDPENPIADNGGYVRRPDIDMSAQMGNMIMAQRAYQANSAVVDRAKDVYESAINIGKGI